MKFKVFQDTTECSTQYLFYFANPDAGADGWHELIDDRYTLIKECHKVIYIGEYTTP